MQVSSRNANRLPIKKKEAALATSPFRFRDNHRINITVIRVTGSISMKLRQPNKQQRLLTDPASLPQLTTREKKEEVLKPTDAAASMEF